jgi:uncharacterized protein (DUF4415 family)
MNTQATSCNDIASDDDLDVPELTPEQLAQGRPFKEAHPEAYRRLTAGKTRITILLDNEVLDAFRQQAESRGCGYQTLINATLREELARRQNTEKALEETIRRVLREELAEIAAASHR